MYDTPPNNHPLVSVVILNYNGNQFVERCLQSVLKDDYASKEILFVDNASTDGSKQLAYPYQDRVTIVENRENYGFPKGCNRGIRVSRGEIVVLLNIDTEVCAGWLTRLIAPLIDDPQIGMTGSKLFFPGGNTIQFAGGVMEPNALTHHIGYGQADGEEFNTPRDVDYLTGASLAIRRDILERLGGLDEGFPLYFEDLDFSCRMKQAGYRILYQPTSVVYHFETYGTKKQSFKYYFKYHRGRIRFILKNFGIRYFFQTFIPYEWQWFHRCDFNKQFAPLACAYASQFGKAPFFWIRGFWQRRVGRTWSN